MARALWSVGSGDYAILDETLAVPNAEQATIEARYSGVSRGTEGLVLRGDVPAALYETMRCPAQEGDFPFPIKYGYALVGVVQNGALRGETVFALHPHQDELILPIKSLVPLPEALPARRAVLGANMETALNVTWDSGAAPGDRILIVGAGVVGLLTGRLATAIPGTEVTICDINPNRRDIAELFGSAFISSEVPRRHFDIAIHASGTEGGLQTAIEAVGLEGTVIEASWFGHAEIGLPLGGWFHPGRLTLKSSQVGQIPPSRAPRWNHRRRLQKALELLRDMPETEILLSHELAFEEAPDLLPALLAPGSDALCPVLKYNT
ncbi:MAG: zinc-binding alcohol dehydrogenase [Pseudomonadota bacterium]